MPMRILALLWVLHQHVRVFDAKRFADSIRHDCSPYYETHSIRFERVLLCGTAGDVTTIVVMFPRAPSKKRSKRKLIAAVCVLTAMGLGAFFYLHSPAPSATTRNLNQAPAQSKVSNTSVRPADE